MLHPIEWLSDRKDVRYKVSCSGVQARRAWFMVLSTLLVSIPTGLPVSAALTVAGSSEEHLKYAEYEVRTAFLLVFAKYTEWPESILPAGNPLVIGVMGDVPLGLNYENNANLSNGGRGIVIKRFHGFADLQPCHILYFSADQERLLPKMRDKLASGSVLTVGETSLFIGYGGAIQLFSEGGRLHFTVNRTALDHSKIRVEAKALALAKQVFTQPEEVQE
jgi:hypothetical protein